MGSVEGGGSPFWGFLETPTSFPADKPGFQSCSLGDFVKRCFLRVLKLTTANKEMALASGS